MKILLNSFHTLKKVRTTFYNRQYHMKVFFDSFHFNGHTARLKSQNQTDPRQENSNVGFFSFLVTKYCGNSITVDMVEVTER